MQNELSRSELKEALWRIIRAEGIEVNNQNIDWLIERAYKEYESEGADDE